jgi:hypothetical protein
MLVAELRHATPVPLRDELERLVGSVLEPRPLHVRVEVNRVYKLRSVLVRLLGDGAHDRLHPDLGLDRDDLTGLDVGGEADGEVGEPVERLLVHGHEDSPSAKGAKLPRDPKPL